MKSHMKISWFMAFYKKPWLVQNHCILNLIKEIRFIKVYDGTKYLVLFPDNIFDLICNTIRNFIRIKSGITYVFSHNFTKIKVSSYDCFASRKRVCFS